MKKLKTILIGVLLYSLMGAVLVNSIETTLIPKFRPFGTSTVFADSTNYVTLNGKGLYVYDSIKAGGWLYVGVLKAGGIALDTNSMGRFYYTGNSLFMENRKTNGFTYLTWGAGGTLSLNMDIAGSLTEAVVIDTSQIALLTGQLKVPGDTASDYDGDDEITLTRQSGKLTTKSLNTAAGSEYTLTWANTMIQANTKVFAIMAANSGTGAPIIRQCSSGSGSSAIIIRNIDGAAAFNSAVVINVLLINAP